MDCLRTPSPYPRAERLRVATQTTHQALDTTIMQARPFDGLARYARFLRVQYGFHRDVAPLYANAALGGLIPGLADLARLDAILQDAKAIGAVLPEISTPAHTAELAMPEALGWLYVAEGSNLGAAFLLKAARQMHLSENHGAAHLAEPPAGRAAHWRNFKTALNAVSLTAAEDARVVAGANAAFGRVRALVALHLDQDA